jgi:hypothetical protein
MEGSGLPFHHVFRFSEKFRIYFIAKGRASLIRFRKNPGEDPRPFPGRFSPVRLRGGWGASVTNGS